MITVIYTAVDRVRIRRNYKTLDGARKFAAYYVGEHPEIGSNYAMAGDGIGKVRVMGATLSDLFPS